MKEQHLTLDSSHLTLYSSEILADLRSAAYLESELHPELNRHRRHEMADICEADNIERVWRILGIAEAQVRMALIRILQPQENILPYNTLRQPKGWRFHFLFPVSKTIIAYLREKIHEYMVAAVMADRTETIIPSAAPTWNERRESALAALRSLAATTRPPSPPVRRPLWPL